MTHPKEQDLALFATGDTGFVQKFQLTRHVRDCTDCSQAVEEYRTLTSALSEPDLDIANWDSLAAEMKANIRLGLEAGACVQPRSFARATGALAFLNPRLAVAAASVMVLLAAGLLLKQSQPVPKPSSTVIASQESVKVDTEGVTITHVYLE
jgi:hypothetical protein